MEKRKKLLLKKTHLKRNKNKRLLGLNVQGICL